ncbi:hypothetical protein Pfo_017602 [Paulownia fortunei]|nr:hypothetical protein Pfo_017602 [Paulownia fortunei]
MMIKFMGILVFTVCLTRTVCQSGACSDHTAVLVLFKFAAQLEQVGAGLKEEVEDASGFRSQDHMIICFLINLQCHNTKSAALFRLDMIFMSSKYYCTAVNRQYITEDIVAISGSGSYPRGITHHFASFLLKAYSYVVLSGVDENKAKTLFTKAIATPISLVGENCGGDKTMPFQIDPAWKAGCRCLKGSNMESASSFNLPTTFKQLISTGSTNNIFSLSFHPINFRTIAVLVSNIFGGTSLTNKNNLEDQIEIIQTSFAASIKPTRYCPKSISRLLTLTASTLSLSLGSRLLKLLSQMAEENFEEQDLGNLQEMENVPEDSHPPEESKGENDAGVVEEKKWPGWPGENVFRLLVPVQRVGGIIGRKGEYIKKICEETKARIKILDGPPGTTERTVMVSAKEEPDLQIPPALDGLLKIHKHIVDAGSDPTNARSGGTVCTRLLVAASQAGSLIGKQGATIKSIQDDSHCTIRVLGEENLPVFALPDDSVVEIQGEPAGLHKAVELIATHLRKFLVDRSVVGVFEMQAPNVRANQNIPPTQSWGPPPPAFPMNPGGHGYGSNHSSMAPHPRQYDDYYPPVDMPSLEKQPRGLTTYGRDLPVGAHTTNVQPQQAVIAKVTQNMQIPLSYADAVIGVNGANISYIRRASGATIAIQETRGVPGEMTVEINGSSSQVQAAQQLIQNSIADAVSRVQNPAGGLASQGYNPYASHGPVYASAPSNAAGQAGYVPTGDYNGANYGY